MKIFLTGATGFIGSHLLNIAVSEGFEIIALRRSEKSIPKIKIEGDVFWLNKSYEEITIEDLFGVDIVIHLAAHSANVPYDTLENCIELNVLQPLKMFEKAKEAGIKNFIVAGSCFEYGKSGENYEFIPIDAPLEPTQTYPASKAISSIAFFQFAIQNRIKLSYLRIFQVFGEGELESRLWPSLKKAAMNGEDFPMTKGEQIRDFIYVKDVASRFVLEAKEIFKREDLSPIQINVGSGKPQTIRDFSEYWWNQWGAKGKLIIGAFPYREGEVMRYMPKL
jgi:nucleoside-diphosphate-sugar epimerase